MDIAFKRAAEIYQAVKSVLKRYYENDGHEHVIRTMTPRGKSKPPLFVITTFHSKSKPTSASVNLFEDYPGQFFVQISVYRGHSISCRSNRCVKIDLMFDLQECYYNIINQEQSVVWIGIDHGEQRRGEVEKLIDDLKRVATKYTDLSCCYSERKVLTNGSENSD